MGVIALREDQGLQTDVTHGSLTLGSVRWQCYDDSQRQRRGKAWTRAKKSSSQEALLLPEAIQRHKVSKKAIGP